MCPVEPAPVSRRWFLGGSAVAAGAAVGVVLPATARAGSPAVGATDAFDASKNVDPSAAGLSDPGSDTVLDAVDPGQLRQEGSTFFATTFVEQAGSYAAPGSDGDLWANCWADDDYVYTANGDGRGFSDEPFKDLMVSRIFGTPQTGLKGEKLAESRLV